MNALVGQRLGRYEVLGLLGAGGMGEVYRAHDRELDRQVAVKVLPEGAWSDRNRLERFELEARIVAGLSHPNIVDLHDFGREGDIVFAVSELLEGRTLRKHLGGGRLPMDEVLEISTALADGLGAAHGQGIVHRDVKPENIFITRSGTVKILDFGIARAPPPPVDQVPGDGTLPTLTGPGMVVGTTGYMSPEQVRGLPVDARSDIFSLGCVIYEMLTGRRAFDGETPADRMMAILNDEPPSAGSLRPDLPPAVDQIVQRCLAKQPETRFESARDVAFALEAISTVSRHDSTTGPEHSTALGRRLVSVAAAAVTIAAFATVIVGGARRFLAPLPTVPHPLRISVAPFQGPVDDPQLRQLAAGLGDVLNRELRILEQEVDAIAWVVPPDAAREEETHTVSDFGRTFGVNAVVTGDLERTGNVIRVDLGVVEAASGSTLRRAIIEDAPSNVEALQEQPLRRVAAALDLKLDEESTRRLQSGRTTMTVALEAYLRGCGELAIAETLEDVENASSLLETSVTEDPMFAAGWLALARACIARAEHSGGIECVGAALANVERAAGLGARANEGWRISAALYRLEGKDEEARSALKQGIRAAPADPEMRLELAELYQTAGDMDNAEAQLQRAVYLRPRYWVGHDRLGRLHLARGANEAAVTQFRHITESAPQNALGFVKLGGVFLYLGEFEKAEQALLHSLKIEPTSYALSNLGALYFDTARFADSAASLNRALEIDSNDYRLWGNLAYAYRFGSEAVQAEGAFRHAVEMAEEQRAAQPDDISIAIHLAGYYAMLDEPRRGLALLEPAAASEPTDPQLIAAIAEAFWDLGETEKALEWVDRSFRAGIKRGYFEDRSTLRDLVADPRYQALVLELGAV